LNASFPIALAATIFCSVQTSFNARLATLDVLLETTIPLFLCPLPSRETLREWFNNARIPRFKANPLARRGGGPVYYSVAAVEQFLRSRIIANRH
jgi:hypothetical protein